MVNGWKVTAVIFIIFTVLELAFIFWIFAIGIQELKNEEICAYSLCLDHDSYSWDTTNQLCSCYKGDFIDTEHLITKEGVSQTYDASDENNYFR